MASVSSTPLRAISWEAVSSGKQAKDDKVSLSEQRIRNDQLAEQNNWIIVDRMVVPGHSREYIDIHECASDMRRRGIDAFDKLIAHWNARDFDILICYGSDRFARTQSLHAYVVEKTVVECAAKIYSWTDGMITRQNMRMFISMTGYKAASDMDRLRDYASKARSRRAQSGLAVSSRVPFSHRIVRDAETGRDTGVALREGMDRLWADLAALLLDGVGYQSLSNELYALGHARADGKPYRGSLFYEALRSPTFWGHTALNYRMVGGKFVGNPRWLWDDAYPPPEGVQLFRDQLPAVYTGELANRIKAELIRRQGLRGRAKPGNTRIWSGLVCCAICGCKMGVVVKPEARQPIRGVRCDHSVVGITRLKESFTCLNRGLVPSDEIRAYITRKLVEWSDGIPVAPEVTDTPTAQHDPRALGQEIVQLQDRINRLIAEQSKASDAVAAMYREQIAALGAQLENLRRRANDTSATDIATAAQQARHTDALNILRADGGVLSLWTRPEREINQLLNMLLGKFRLGGYRRKIIGLIDPKELNRLD